VNIDTSSLVAITAREPSASRLVAALEADPVRIISAATVAEASIVLAGRYGDTGLIELDLLLNMFDVQIVAFEPRHIDAVRVAFSAFGKGRHPARLNFGDCFSYALSRVSGEPLLCVGEDFRKTDIPLVQW
jgi:ribonuclease VapC